MFTVPNLPYDYSALEPHIDEQTMRIHHDKHHASYVKNLNEALKEENNLGEMDVVDLMKNLAKVPEELRTKVRNNGGGHANHSLFWNIMGSNAAGQPQGALADAIAASFGDFETFKDIFSKAALGRFGSGWAWLIVEGNTVAVTDTANQDTPLSEAVPAGRQGKTPILGLDVWEHAYYLKYQNRRADYIKAWWNVVNWNQVAQNFETATR